MNTPATNPAATNPDTSEPAATNPDSTDPSSTSSSSSSNETSSSNEASSSDEGSTQWFANPQWRRWIVGVLVVVGVLISVIYLWPVVRLALQTVSTDDAYVNGHVTIVAPRVAGQIASVLVEDNNRVKKGDVLAELDPEPFQRQFDIKQSAVTVATADLVEAEAQVVQMIGEIRANRFALARAIEDVRDNIATLHAGIATLHSQQAALELSKSNLRRGEELAPTSSISQEELDQRRQTVKSDEASVEQALEQVYAIRASLGLKPVPDPGAELSDVPEDLDQNFSSVREALAKLIASAAQIGYFPTSWDESPAQAIERFREQAPDGDLDQIYAKLIANAPTIQQAQARLQQAKSDLAEAKLNLQYCRIISDIDGVVTRRNVNPGNYVQVGQSLMAVRSLTEIWIDANFKETQLADLRIGQRAMCRVDMYGDEHEFEGRITGFTMGTGQTLSILPPQNATGNFVKIVQRLPVRIELTNHDPNQFPLFVGLSVEPHVYFKEAPSGPHAGEVLQP